MDTTDGFIRSLFRTEKPKLGRQDFEDPEVWVCDLLNGDPALVNEYIAYRLENAQTSNRKLAFLYECRDCFQCGLKDLKILKEDPDNLLSCCNGHYADDVDRGIAVYQDYIEKIEMAICHFTDCESLKCEDVPNEVKGRKNAEHTTARQVLAVYYLAEHLGIWGGIDKSNLESFTAFLTGKSPSDIHKKFTNPTDNKEDLNQKRKDLKFVKSHFEKLGLRDVVSKINGDMP